MNKKMKIIISVFLLSFVLISTLNGSTEKGTIIEFVDDAVIIESEDGKKVTRIEHYQTYIPTGEQWSVGDSVEIKDGGIFNELSIRCLIE